MSHKTELISLNKSKKKIILSKAMPKSFCKI